MPTTAQAQTDTLRTSLKKGAGSLQFRVTPNLTLGSFDGATFSGKWHLSNRKALRIGIDISGFYTNSETNTIRQSTNSQGGLSTETTVEEGERNSTSLSIRSYFMAYPNPGGAMNFYTGIGPFVTWSVGNEDDNTVRTLQGGQMVFNDETGDNSQFNVGLGFVLGIEWFVQSRMSLTAEYLVSAFYSTVSNDFDGVQTDSVTDAQQTNVSESSISQIRIAGNGARLGISVYF